MTNHLVLIILNMMSFGRVRWCCSSSFVTTGDLPGWLVLRSRASGLLIAVQRVRANPRPYFGLECLAGPSGAIDLAQPVP